MADPNTAPPPVAPTEGNPSMPPDEQINEFFDALEAKSSAEMYNKMAAQCPPILMPKFIERFGRMKEAVAYPPVDENDVRQADAKRGEPAPNEPEQYVDERGNPIDPKVLPADNDGAKQPEAGSV